MKRIGVYGGSFNPVHVGHIAAASEAMEKLGLEKLLFVPANVAPHKDLSENSVSPRHRLEMLKIAAAPLAGMEVSDVELRRSGPSYTFETLEQLKAEYPDRELVLLLGSDMFCCVDRWKEFDSIRNNASLAALSRGTKEESADISAQAEKLGAMGAKVCEVRNKTVTVSSTDVRRLLVFRAAGSVLPAGVEAYIRANGLYNTGDDYTNLPMEQLVTVVTGLLNPNRVRHVLGCRDTAGELARRWGANEEDALRAGLLHDITKALDGPLQLTLCSEYGMMLDEFGQKNPKTLHALTGSLIAQRIFGENEEVVKAIRWHTTGRGGMSTLEKIIYIADYMEPNRDFSGVEKLREAAFTDLDGAVKLGIEMTVEQLKSKHSSISPESLEALRDVGGTL